MFENISKGEWKHFKFSKGNIEANNRLIANCTGYSTNVNVEEETAISMENAEFIIFCGNLQQRLDISCYEEVIKALESLKNSIQSHPDFIWGDENDEWHTLTGITEQILNKAKK